MALKRVQPLTWSLGWRKSRTPYLQSTIRPSGDRLAFTFRGVQGSPTHFNTTSKQIGAWASRAFAEASARTPFAAALGGTTSEPTRTTNDLIERTNYLGNKRRRDEKGRDIGLEEQKSGGAGNETAEETGKENHEWRGLGKMESNKPFQLNEPRWHKKTLKHIISIDARVKNRRFSFRICNQIFELLP